MNVIIKMNSVFNRLIDCLHRSVAPRSLLHVALWDDSVHHRHTKEIEHSMLEFQDVLYLVIYCHDSSVAPRGEKIIRSSVGPTL